MVPQKFLYRHPRLGNWIAALTGLAAAGAICLLALFLLVISQWRQLAQTQAQAGALFLAVRNEGNELMARLNREFKPVCTESNLRRLRSVIVFSHNIGDIGILDENGRLACSTALGILATPVALPPPDGVFKAANGIELTNRFNVPILASETQASSLISSMGRFSAVINPLSMTSLSMGGSTVVHFAYSGQPVRTVVKSDSTTPDMEKLLHAHAVAGFSGRKFDWSSMTFLMSVRPPNSAYVLSTATTTGAFLNGHAPELAFAIACAALVGVLCFFLMRQAIEKRNSMAYRIFSLLRPENIVCNYQPIIDLATGTTKGCEVLFRLRDGDTILTPDKVLPAIVRNKLTWQLDQLVVRIALTEVSRHLPDLTGFQLAFNLFPENVNHYRVTTLFRETLRIAPNPGVEFELEVIEEAYNETLAKEAALLRRDGYLISVDDFGTGYSNLGSIKALAPDLLKIDRSFVMDMEDQSLRSSLIQEIVVIAKAVRARVIAEGIENEAQRDLLHSMGVEFGQGYWFAKPMPIEALAKYLNRP